MRSILRFVKILVLVVVLIAAVVVVITNYSWVFSKRITGVVVDVERVTDPTAVFGARATEQQMYSYSVLIRGDDGQLYSSSSEDRQWQVVKKGYCVEALLYRYPPWSLDQAGTFFNARLKQVKLCPGQSELPQNTQGPAGPVTQPTPMTTPPAPEPAAK